MSLQGTGARAAGTTGPAGTGQSAEEAEGEVTIDLRAHEHPAARIVLHDFAGHPFQIDLSRSLARLLQNLIK
jgi:hypothetical protein